MKRFGLLTGTFLATAAIAGCFFEAGGCSGNACFSVADYDCDGYYCDEPLDCEDSETIRQRMAAIISEARLHARDCGVTRYQAANTVYWNDKLGTASDVHSLDMARHNFLSHTGSDGSTPASRATEAGYDYARIAENIAGGHETSTSVVNAWLDSPEHCANIMNPALDEIGAACVRDYHSDYRTYWTLLLGSPRID
ncbi:MAG: CAP domain-containing protein [Gammaproteobacteria bacterium]|nr:CAP domain-containing protein [Gammaproteobacteria bacterium]